MRAKTGNPDITFAELRARPARFRELYIVASDLSRRRAQVFSHTTSPDLPVALAVRASMSIPLFFESLSLDGATFGVPGGKDVFVDGGLLANYPLFVFDRPPFVPTAQPNRETLGFALVDLERSADARADIHGWRDYSQELIEALLAVQERAFFDSPDDRSRTVVTDSLGVRTTDFELSTGTECELMRRAAIATCSFLEAGGR